MKTKLIVLAILLTACAKDKDAAAPQGECASVAGVYHDYVFAGTGAILTPTCKFTDTHCGYVAKASNIVPTSETDGTFTLTVESTNGQVGCLASTSHSCTYGFDAVDFAFICGSYFRYFHR